MSRPKIFVLTLLTIFLTTMSAHAADFGLRSTSVKLQAAGPLAFGPDGILFVGDPQSATIYAIDTEEKQGEPAKVTHEAKGFQQKLAKAISASSVTVADLAVHPISGSLYLTVSPSDDDSKAALVKVDPTGTVSQLALDDVKSSRVDLPNPPEDKVTGEGRRRRNHRRSSITDLAYVDGRVVVSGLSSGDSPSTVREIGFPFAKSDEGARLEIYHGAHGKYEDHAPVQTFAPLKIDGEISVVAGFTCTPLVRIPLSKIASGEKIRGTTVAELGNRNRPLDMISYKKDGATYLLMSNSARGVMKIPAAGIDQQEAITARVGDTAGQPYETIDGLENVVQLDQLNDDHAVVIVASESGVLDLKTIELP